jgi:hypothetical protein
MIYVSNKGVGGTTILFFYSYIVILQFEYFYNFKMPKFITVKNVLSICNQNVGGKVVRQ